MSNASLITGSFIVIPISIFIDWLTFMRISAFYTDDSPTYMLSAARGFILLSVGQYAFWTLNAYVPPDSAPTLLIVPFLLALGLYAVVALKDVKRSIKPEPRD